MQLGNLHKVFRSLVVVSTICCLLVAASRWLLWGVVSLKVYEVLNGSGVGAVLPLALGWMWLVMLLRVAVAIGMCRYNPRARFVCMALAVFDLVVLLLGGVLARTAFEAFLATAASLMNGAILALAYLSPLRRRFETWWQRRDDLMSKRTPGKTGPPTALDRLSHSPRIQRLRVNYVASIRSRPHYATFRSRLLNSIRDAILRMSYFQRAEKKPVRSVEHKTENHAV